MTNFPQIPNYRIIKKLGEGGMAHVYMGIQEKLERTVAIKVLKSHHLKDENFAKRFLKEAETAANLIHPNIVTIYDVGEFNGLYFIVMELLESSLKDKIKQRILDGARYKMSLEDGETMIEPISSITNSDNDKDGTFYGCKESSDIIKQIGSALDYAHLEGFIHRDIKPDNILFRKDRTPVLVDFGIARPINASSGMTTEGIIIGTPHYMSPEQCHGEKIDKRSDFYSLGVVYYELLTGKVPYKADSATGILVKHIKNPIPILPDKLKILQPFVNKSMSKDKTARITNNKELLDMMNPLLKEFDNSLLKKENKIKSLENDWIFNDDNPHIDNLNIDKNELESDASSSGLKLFFMVTFLAIVVVAYFIFIYKSSDSIIKDNSEVSTVSPKKNTFSKKNNKILKNKLINKKENLKSEQIKRYLILAEEYLSKKEFDNAQDKIELAKEIYYSKNVKALETEIKIQKTEYIEKKKLENYNNLIQLSNEALLKKEYKTAYENLRSAALINETDEVKSLVDKVLQEEKDSIALKKAIERKKKERRFRDNNAYKRAKSINKVYGYETYLKKFPNGRFKKESQRRIEDLKSAILIEETGKDNIAFEEAKKSGTISSYEKYIKTHRVGKFITIAQQNILVLKEKIRKETKIKFNVKYIKFFNKATGSPGKPSLRIYSTKFKAVQSNYIFSEIKLLNKFYKIEDFNTKIYIEYKNAKTKFVFKTKIKNITQSNNLSNFIYTTGMGWKAKAKWTPGKYIVSIYMDEKSIGNSTFVIE